MAFFSLALVDVWNCLLVLNVSSLNCSLKVGNCPCFSTFGLHKDIRNQYPCCSSLIAQKCFGLSCFSCPVDLVHAPVWRWNLFNAAWSMMNNTSCDHFYNQWIMVRIWFSFARFALAGCLYCVNDLSSETRFPKGFPFVPQNWSIFLKICSYSSFVALWNCCVLGIIFSSFVACYETAV